MAFEMLRLRGRLTLLLLAPALVVGCLKTLDESKIGAADASTEGGSGATGGDAGGSGGSGGTSGTGGTGGTVDSGPDSPWPGVVPYDASKYPVTNLASTSARAIISVDDSDVFRTELDGISVPLFRHPIAGGSGNQVPGFTLERPQAMVAPTGSISVFVVGGTDQGGGTLVRVPKAGGAAESITPQTPIELAVGIAAAADGYAYVSTKAIAQNTTALLRFQLTAGATTGETLYVTADGNESGGDVVVTGGCVYWVSNGDVWGIPTTGGARLAALSTAITDAVGVAADAVYLYYTRAGGSVWRKKVSTACDSGSSVEEKLTEGFTGIGDLVTYEGKLAWTAEGDVSANFAGGGVFSSSAAGGQVTQIAPEDDGPVDIAAAPADIVYATSSGLIRKVPKKPL